MKLQMMVKDQKMESIVNIAEYLLTEKQDIVSLVIIVSAALIIIAELWESVWGKLMQWFFTLLSLRPISFTWGWCY